MKLEILFVLIFCFIVFYDGYIKGPIRIVYSYGRILFGLGLCIYLFYSYYKSPEDFKEALRLVQSFFTKSDDVALNQFLTKQLPKIDYGNNNKNIKRNVSVLLKKKVASSQEWKCGHCKSLLDASYEVDHIVALYRGGTNEEKNLIALCRNCHGKKTVEERLL